MIGILAAGTTAVEIAGIAAMEIMVAGITAVEIMVVRSTTAAGNNRSHAPPTSSHPFRLALPE